MAIVGTYVTGWGSAGAGSVTVNSAGQNIQANTLLIAGSLTRASAANLSDVTISSPHLTWTRIGTPQNIGTSSPTRRIELWYSFVVGPLAGEVVSQAIANGLSQTEYGTELCRFTGIDVGTPIRTANLVQGDSGVTSATSFTLTFPGAFGTATNGAVVYFGSNAGNTSTMTPRTNWTELREFADSNDHHEVQYIAVNDTDASFTNGTSGVNAGIAVELVADTQVPNIVKGRLQRPALRINALEFLFTGVTNVGATIPTQFHTPGIMVRRQRRIY